MHGHALGGGATQRLTRARAKFGAMKLLLLGEVISADTALQWGLVAEVLDDEALALAQQLCPLPTVALRLTKASVLMAMETPLSAGPDGERRALQTAFASPGTALHVRYLTSGRVALLLENQMRIDRGIARYAPG